MQGALFEEFNVILQRSLDVVVEVSISDIYSEIVHGDEWNEGEDKNKENMHPGCEVIQLLVIEHHLLIPVVTDWGERNIGWNTDQYSDYEEVEGLTHQMPLETHVYVSINPTVRRPVRTT